MKRALIHVGVFLSMVVGMIVCMATIGRTTWLRIFDKVLSAFGFDFLSYGLCDSNRILNNKMDSKSIHKRDCVAGRVAN